MNESQTACVRAVWKNCPRNFRESFAVYLERVVAFMFWDKGGIALMRMFEQPEILWIEAYAAPDCKTPTRERYKLLQAVIELAKYDPRAKFLAAAVNEKSAGILSKMGFQQIEPDLYSVKLH